MIFEPGLIQRMPQNIALAIATSVGEVCGTRTIVKNVFHPPGFWIIIYPAGWIGHDGGTGEVDRSVSCRKDFYLGPRRSGTYVLSQVFIPLQGGEFIGNGTVLRYGNLAGDIASHQAGFGHRG